MAAVLNLSGLAKAHKPVAGAALPIAGRTEGRNIPQLHEPADHFIQRSLVGHVELLRIGGTLLLLVAADGGAGAAADLRHAQRQDPLPDSLALPCGDNHARIGHGNTNQGAQLGEGIVADAVVKGAGIDIIGVLDTGDTDGMGADAVDGFQVFGVHQQARELIAVPLQSKQYAQAHIVDAALHGPVHGFRVVVIVVLGAGGVQLLIALLVVRLLEENIGADAGLFQHPVLLHRGGGNVDVDAADIAVFVVDGIDGFDALENVFNGVVFRVLTGFDGQPLVAHVLQGDDLPGHLLLGQLLTADVLVFGVVGAVDTAVDAVVGQVQGGKQHNAVAVEFQLDLLGQIVHPLEPRLILTGQQNRGFPVAQALTLGRLVENGVHQVQIVLVGVGIDQGVENFLVVDEFRGFQGMGIVHD